MADMIEELIEKSNGGAAEPETGQPEPTTPVAEQEPTPEPTPEPINEPVTGQEWFKEFGFTSPDEAKAVFEKAKGFDPNEYEQVKSKAQKADEYAAALEQMKNVSPYRNQDFKRLEQVEETNPELYPIYKKLVFGEPNEEELIKLDIVKNNPILKGKDEQIQRKFDRMYPGLKDFQKAKEIYEADSDEYREAEQAYNDSLLDIELDSARIKEGLMKDFKSIQVAEPTKVDPKEVERFETEWKNELTKTLDNVGKITIEVKSEDGKSKEALMDIDPKEAKKYLNQAMAFVKGNNLEIKKENVEAVREMAKRLWILDNIEEYNTQIADHVSKKVAKDKDAQWRQKVHNPEPASKGKPVNVQSDPDKELFEQVQKDLFRK